MDIHVETYIMLDSKLWARWLKQILRSGFLTNVFTIVRFCAAPCASE